MQVDLFIEALLRLDRVAAERIVTLARIELSLDEVVATLVVPALERIGDAWVEEKVSLSEVYMSSRICEALMRASASARGSIRTSQPSIAVAALQDYHLLGKKMVELVLRSSGYEYLDWGQGIGVEELVGRVREARVDVLLISTLMLPSALKVRDVRERLDRAGLRTQIMVGGAPFRFDDRLWSEVGADAMGVSASDALKILEGSGKERACATR
jgi:methanogenic corrinoid protein MtbC1